MILHSEDKSLNHEDTKSRRKYKAYPSYKDSGVEWLGNLPKSWILTKVKRLFYIGRGRVISQEELIDEGAYPVYSSQTLNNGELGFINTYDFDCEQITWTTDGANAGTVFLRHGKHNCTNVCGTLVASHRDIVLNYFNYFLSVATEFYKRPDTNGAKIMNNEMAEIILTFPSYPEQTFIANFLDHETAKIDLLIEKQQQLIQLLKEKRQAVISHAVTKGLNPKTPMKKSGVEWLGEVPEHWYVKRFKFVCENIISGPFGSSITKDMYVKKGYKVYGQEQVIPADFSIGDYYISEQSYNELSRYSVTAGELLISCVGTFGKIAVFPKGAEKGIINPRLIKALIKDSCDPFYFQELLKSEMVFKQFELLSRGGTMGVINIGILSEILTLVPPINEQKDIVEFVQNKKAKYDLLMLKSNQAVLLLKERRTALISAAVTGKIDVRDWLAPKG